MFGFVWLLVKILLSFILLCILYVCFKHFRVLKQARYYTEQGIVKLRGFDTFFIGNVVQILEFKKLRIDHI